jgi:5-(carboxyamino)imidazole ribonucleotide synthase
MKIGLLGGGQLGRMLALAGYTLGLRFRTLDLSPDAPTGQLTELMVADFNDVDALRRFAAGLDLVTYEFENVPVDSARFLSERLAVYPPPEALEKAQDRAVEKTFFQSLRIPTPPFSTVDSWEEFEEAVERTGLPAVLKTRRFGYDGKGQFELRKSEDMAPAWRSLGGVPLILESFVAFEREVSIIAVRSLSGATAFYPLVENHHRAGMLRLSIAPAPALAPALQSLAEEYALRVMDALNYVGVLAIEFFECEEQLYANEMAPRVHNSGHWTIEGAATSQFENHLRAIMDLPLGPTAALKPSAMINIIGRIPDIRTLLQTGGLHLHLYGKSARPNRKLGHVTLCADDLDSLKAQVSRIRALVDG